MKNKRKILVLSALLAAITFSGSFAPQGGVAFANSANREYYGYDSSGVIVTTENCPIVVDKEDLTFDVKLDGKSSGNSQTAYAGNATAMENATAMKNSTAKYASRVQADVYAPLTYKGNVTAEYTFRNPSDLTAKVRCMFPFGFLPNRETNVTPGAGDFAVKKNGAKIDAKIRYSFKPYIYDAFDPEIDWKTLSDDFNDDGFYKTEMPVYEYEITVGKGGGKNLPEYVGFSYRKRDEILVLDSYSRKYENNDGLIKLTQQVGDDGKVTIAFINRNVSVAESDFEFFDSKLESTSGSVTVEAKPVRELKDYLLGFRPSELGASDVDWYNATVTMLEYRSGTLFKRDLSLDDGLFCWYDYTLDFEPGETLVNTVVAPLFPTVNAWYEPPKYVYTYLLSPAATWANFKDLTVRINTDMYLLNSRTEKRTLDENGRVYFGELQDVKFEKKDGFFEAHFDELPDGELIFTLCSEENPGRYRSSYGYGCFGCIGLLRMFC